MKGAHNIENYNEEVLAHYGVKGMRWGVRRYQKYDGTYTKKGVARFKKADSDYEAAKEKAQRAKVAYKSGRATSSSVKDAKGEVKVAKRKMRAIYNKLKTDKMADEGKKLYQQGKTITSNTAKTAITEAAVVAGGNIVGALLANSGNLRLASVAGSTIALGGTAVNLILAGKNTYEAKRLRAYYSH